MKDFKVLKVYLKARLKILISFWENEKLSASGPRMLTFEDEGGLSFP